MYQKIIHSNNNIVGTLRADHHKNTLQQNPFNLKEKKQGGGKKRKSGYI